MKTYYAQSRNPEPTMTVGELVRRLQAFDPSERVVFRTPLFGSFGSNTAYTIDSVEHETLAREELHNEGYEYVHDETGEKVVVEAETQVFYAWSGVVIQ